MSEHDEAHRVAPILAAAAIVRQADEINARIKTWTELLKGASEKSKPPNSFYEERIQSDKALHARLLWLANFVAVAAEPTP
jgi:hypothetical protein